MSKVSTNVSNLKYLPIDEKSSLCFGELSISIKDSDTFNIPGNINKDSHIITTNSKSDNILRNLLSSAPLIPEYNLTIYDYSSTVTNKYLKERKNNSPGSVTNKLSQIKLLSQIQLPVVSEDEDIYLVLDSYDALKEVFLESSKKHIIINDLNVFCSNNSSAERKNINLFVTKEIHDVIIRYSSLDNMFKKVWVCNEGCLSSLVEHLMGKTIYCSDKSYQGHLRLSSGFDISSVLISSKSTDSMIGRSNGILQYNTFNGSSSFKFIIILEHKEHKTNIKFYENEELISSSELLQESDTKVNFDYIRSFKENYDFCNQIKGLDGEEKKQFILENSEKIIKYFLTKLESKDHYDGDNLELIHLSNIDYLQIIKTMLISEFKTPDYSYMNMKQFGLPYNNQMPITNNIPLERHISAAVHD